MFLNNPQADFLEVDKKYRAFVGGLGSGKSFVGATGQCIHFMEHPRVPQGYFAPSYGLIRDIFYPLIEEVAFEFGMSVEIMQGNKEVHFYKGRQFYGTTICRTMDKPGSIIGFKIGRAFVDEIDTMPTDKATTAWRKIIARLRHTGEGVKNGADVTTTPEGFLFTYNRFKKLVEEDKTGEVSKIYGSVHASTYDNEANLPEDYIPSLITSYPEQLITAYIDGKYTNLKSGTIYYSYDEESNNTSAVHEQNEPVHIGMDFNVRNMSAIVNVIRNNESHAVDELLNVLDTPSMIDLIKDRYAGCSIVVYPDASGANTSSKGAAVSDISLLQDANFWIEADKNNPRVKDRVNSANAAFEQRRCFVNREKCPELSLSLQQQVYDKNGMPEKRQDSSIDDINDAYTYFVNRKYPINFIRNPRVKGYY